LRSEAVELIVEQGVVTGVEVQREGRRERVMRAAAWCAPWAVSPLALAAGYRPPQEAPHLTMSPPANDGAALRLGRRWRRQGEAWRPTSSGRRFPSCATPMVSERFPHLVTDRAKPGVIAVTRRARFVNESDSYHHFVQTMFANGIASCWLICDAAR
jgi:hypothetical protein